MKMSDLLAKLCNYQTTAWPTLLMLSPEMVRQRIQVRTRMTILISGSIFRLKEVTSLFSKDRAFRRR